MSYHGALIYEPPCLNVLDSLWSCMEHGSHVLIFCEPYQHHRYAIGMEAQLFVLRDSIAWLSDDGLVTIIVAMKPPAENYAWNAINLGLSGLNIDACRVSVNDNGWNVPSRDGEPQKPGLAAGNPTTGRSGDRDTPHSLGRWPGNVIFASDAADALDVQTGHSESSSAKQMKPEANYKNKVYGRGMGGTVSERNQHSDSGGGSRFFARADDSRSLVSYLSDLIRPPDGIDRRLLWSSPARCTYLAKYARGWETTIAIPEVCTCKQ